MACFWLLSMAAKVFGTTGSIDVRPSELAMRAAASLQTVCQSQLQASSVRQVIQGLHSAISRYQGVLMAGTHTPASGCVHAVTALLLCWHGHLMPAACAAQHGGLRRRQRLPPRPPQLPGSVPGRVRRCAAGAGAGPRQAGTRLPAPDSAACCAAAPRPAGPPVARGAARRSCSPRPIRSVSGSACLAVCAGAAPQRAWPSKPAPPPPVPQSPLRCGVAHPPARPPAALDEQCWTQRWR